MGRQRASLPALSISYVEKQAPKSSLRIRRKHEAYDGKGGSAFGIWKSCLQP